MIDLKILRNDLNKVKKALKDRQKDLNVDEIFELENFCRQINHQIETLTAKKNVLSKEISSAIQKKDENEVTRIKQSISQISNEIIELKNQVTQENEKLENKLLFIPNLQDESVPFGIDEDENVEIRKFGQLPNFNFEAKEHWQLGKDLNLIDLETATVITGSRFSIYKNKGAKLVRALQSLTLDILGQNGFEEYALPVIVNERSLINTGQFPNLKDDTFSLNFKDFYLSPTLEVQLTNMFRNQILDPNNLPYRVTSSSLNFRLEAGSAGKDMKGLIRQHQFYKTEMVVIAHPKESFNELERMVDCAEQILQALKLPYRVITLCTGDLGFAAAKTYDLEVYLPSVKKYREISSCSNCIDFQARRAMIRFKNEDKNELVHTLNGSGLAIDRLWVAVVENYQQANGTILVPDALKKYLDFDVIDYEKK